MTKRADPPWPRRADVADGYDRGVSAYEAVWSPVILPPAAALVRSLGLTGRCVVADVGAGTGALLGAIRSAAPTARVVALDASAEMLRRARTRRGAPAVLADALAVPLADGTADAVILAYVLFHLADPSLALAEAARVLRPGGRVGAITWAWERGSRADAVWDQVLTEAGVPPGPPRRVDAGLDRPDAVDALLRSAGRLSCRGRPAGTRPREAPARESCEPTTPQPPSQRPGGSAESWPQPGGPAMSRCSSRSTCPDGS